MQPGDHLITPRRPYSHHGIYVGRGRVVHYSGLARKLEAGPVVVTSPEDFHCGRTVRVKPHPDAAFSRKVIVERALSRLGEDEYNLLTNNCEHLVYWCIHGVPRSDQVRNAAALALAACGASPVRAALSPSWLRSAPSVAAVPLTAVVMNSLARGGGVAGALGSSVLPIPAISTIATLAGVIRRLLD